MLWEDVVMQAAGTRTLFFEPLLWPVAEMAMTSLGVCSPARWAQRVTIIRSWSELCSTDVALYRAFTGLVDSGPRSVKSFAAILQRPASSYVFIFRLCSSHEFKG